MNESHLINLLKSRGVDPQATRVYLMRHADERYPDLVRYIGTQALTVYQAIQAKPHVPGSLVVGFFGLKSSRGLLLGTWRVERCLEMTEARSKGLLEGSFVKPDDQQKPYFLELTETDVLRDLRLKLEVRWRNPRAWHRELIPENNFEVALRQGCPVPYRGLGSVSLVMSELRIVLHDVEWQAALSSTSGVYLITDERTGRHYVGSACGELGIRQRWADYAATRHGDNTELKAIVDGNPGRENDFRFTLLETLAIGTPRAQAVARENYWKVAMGSRTFGLNCN